MQSAAEYMTSDFFG